MGGRGCTVEVDARLCKGCGICVSMCPRKALELSRETGQTGYRRPVLSGECAGCRLCELYCPDFAVVVVCEG